MLLHEGQYLDEVMRNIESFLENSQSKVNGEVYINLLPFRFELDGIKSPNDLMNENMIKTRDAIIHKIAWYCVSMSSHRPSRTCDRGVRVL